MIPLQVEIIGYVLTLLLQYLGTATSAFAAVIALYMTFAGFRAAKRTKKADSV